MSLSLCFSCGLQPGFQVATAQPSIPMASRGGGWARAIPVATSLTKLGPVDVVSGSGCRWECPGYVFEGALMG